MLGPPGSAARFVVLVTGCTGIVGHGIIDALINHSEKTIVVAVVRSGTSNFGTAEWLDSKRVHVVPAIAADGSMDGLAELVKGAIGDRKIDHVVSCFGGAAPRKLLSSMEDTDVLASAERALPHLRLLKSVVPSLVAPDQNPDSSYTFVTGMLGERCFMPDKLTGLTLSNSLLYGMIAAFRAELSAAGNPLRVRELRIGSMLHKPCSSTDNSAGGQHPTIPSSSAEMKSFSSDIVGRVLLDAIEKGFQADVIRLQDEDFRDYM